MMHETPYVHQQVVSSSSDLSSFFFENLTPEEHPLLIAIGGGPCSGKTTWRRKMQSGLKNYFLHDMDEVMVRLTGYKEDFRMLEGKAAFEKWWPFARELSEEWVRLAIKSRYSMLYDRTCGAESSYQDLLQAKSAGYTIRFIGLTVDRSVAIERARTREQSEGRVITEEIIDEYRSRFSDLWPKYLAFVDEAFLYDTTENPPKLIFSSRGGCVDPILYEKFLAEGRKKR
jgi:predicted ABC-type ATPase